MFTINRCQLEAYMFNQRNSIPAEAADSTYPGHPAQWAIDIKTIVIEEKTVLLKQLKIGSTIVFQIDQEIKLSIPDNDEDLTLMVKGEGQGEISEISDLDINIDDNEYQEITIKLINGFAENL